MASKFNFGAIKRAMKQQCFVAMQEIALQTREEFDKGFENEGMRGEPKWKEVARRTAGTPFYKKQVAFATNRATGNVFMVDQGADWRDRNILTGTSRQLRSNNRIKSVTSRRAVIENKTPYAEYINEGTPYMDARPFIMQTDYLTQMQLAILLKETGRAWQLKP